MRLSVGLYSRFVFDVRVNIVGGGARLKASTEITVYIDCRTGTPNTNNGVASLIGATPFAADGFAHDTPKTRTRSVLIIDALPELRAWLQKHPRNTDPNCPLWIQARNRMRQCMISRNMKKEWV